MSEIVIRFVEVLTTIFWIAILARVILSWVPIDQSSPFHVVVAFVHEITEPVLGPIRSVLPSFGFLDLSPMVALLLMAVIQFIVRSALAG